MNATQRQHVFSLSVIGLTLALAAAVVAASDVRRATGVFGLIGFAPLGLLFFHPRLGVAAVADERDADIQRRALTIAFTVFWAAFVASTVGVWFVVGDDRSIPTRYLPTITYLAWGTWQATHSIAVLAQYRRAS